MIRFVSKNISHYSMFTIRNYPFSRDKKSSYHDKVKQLMKDHLEKKNFFTKKYIDQFSNMSKVRYNQQIKTKSKSSSNRNQYWRNLLISLSFMIFISFIKFQKTNQDKLITDYDKGINLLSSNKVLEELVIICNVSKHNYCTFQCHAIKQAQQNNNPRRQIKFIVPNLQVFLQTLEKLPTDYKVSFRYQNRFLSQTPTNAKQAELFFQFLNFGIIAVIFLLVRKKFRENSGKNFQLGSLFSKENKFKPIDPQKISTKFKDVAGMHEAKVQITEFVQFLKQPDYYISMGAKIPKGALLAGPPGTGKTLLAKACAGEAGVPFFYVSGSDFVEKYVGLGAFRVRQLFQKAEKQSPSIIFIDEIDAIGKKRSSGPFANEEKDNTLNQLLVKMDGFDTKNKVIVMAATNRKDMLDPALLRPGRFDRTVEIGLPNFQERIEILKVHLVKVQYNKQEYAVQQLANKISILTPGFSGAQLANVCNEAAILAARIDNQFVTIIQFQKAIERVMAGLEKRNMFSDDEKELLAYYQSGKAVVGWYTQGADPLIKISILPFSKSGKGYSHSIRDQNSLYTKQQLFGKIISYLGGRAAEIHFKGYPTTNGDQDLNKAKQIVEYMVTKFGMSQQLKMIAFPQVQFIRKPYSEQTQAKIDRQIKKITEKCKAEAEELIKQKADLIELIKAKLMEKETLNHDQLKQILGDKKFQDNNNYQAFLDKQLEQKTKNQLKQKVQPQQQISMPVQ